MDEKLRKKIKEDLNKSGFGSELKSMKIFEKCDFSVFAGSYYFDKDEEKLREIDMVSVLSLVSKNNKKKNDNLLFNKLTMSVEVKKSEKPWVVFKSHNQSHTNYFFKSLKFMRLNNTEDMLLSKELENKNFDNWNLMINGIHESFKPPGNTSKWYTACLSTIKGIDSIYEGHVSNEDEGYGFFEYATYQPLIILDGKLVSAEMNNSLDIELEEINFARMEMKLETKKYKSKYYLIDIVTLSGLEEYLKMMKERLEVTNDIIKKNEGFESENTNSWYDI